MRILKLEAEKVMRLQVVELIPDENKNLVIIGGRNAQGKSSVLNAIEMALRGKASFPVEPVAHGNDAGKVVLDLGQLVVERVIKADGGGKLVVRNKEGAVYPTPQKLLDALVEGIAFDPLAFSRMDARRQLEILRGIVPELDFSLLDAGRKTFYDERTAVNRMADQAEAEYKNLPAIPDGQHLGAPIDLAPIKAELDGAQAKIESNKEIQNKVELWRERHKALLDQAEANKAQIEALRKKNDEIQAGAVQAEEAIAKGQKMLIEAECPDVSKLMNDMEIGRALNDAIRNRIQIVNQHDSAQAKLAGLKSKAEDLSEAIKKIDLEKSTRMGATKFPIKGLAFDERGVTFNGLPFSQSSSAEQLRVSVSMGLALHPKLKVMLIRDGSLLDDENLSLLADVAKENDAQLWLERVSQGAEVSVVIEDGRVKEDRTPKGVAKAKASAEETV